MKLLLAAISMSLLAAGCVDDNSYRGGNYHRGAHQGYSSQTCDKWRRQARNGNRSARRLYDRNCRGGRDRDRRGDNRHGNNRHGNNKSAISPRACAAWRELAKQGNQNAVSLYNANCRRHR